jgi:hypothetical protein
MRYLLLAVALVLGSCGDDTTSTVEECVDCVPADHAHPDMVPADHDHPDMVPAVHDHPDAEPLTGLEATGRYLLAGPLTVDTCADPSLADPDTDIDLGKWLVVAMQDELLFMQGDFIMSSSDGETFIVETEGIDFWTGCEYTQTVTATLSFTTQNLEGPIDLHFDQPACGELEQVVCDRTWEVLGTRQ